MSACRGRGGVWRFLCMVGAVLPMLAGCTAPAMVLGAAGVASDTSITWEVVKHLHAKMTEGDDVPCLRLDSVARALSPRCGAFVAGSLRSADIRAAQWQGCPLSVALENPRLWPVVPELLDKGAQPEACEGSPLAALARVPGCPDFSAASPKVLQSMTYLAQADARAVDHDVVRMLSCPGARAVGLDAVLVRWAEQGELDPSRVGFGVLGALDPSALATPLARALESQGHTARASLGAYVGVQPAGFETALRHADWAALDWWFSRVPELVRQVPPTQGAQLPWVPLARVLVPTFMVRPEQQGDMIDFLVARGADPRQGLPFEPHTTVRQYARAMHSPWVARLDGVPFTVASRAATQEP